ncbi:multi antimicrobial extrusion protein MatE [Gracilibacillus kekensis]|uniref:Na+-driven multidrug efflux pump n=1 Tax=Gracilibacillus kekensis TaxID=1027249 RepID=A0A1M7JUH4_9BACI|nr:multi antimicrobial extrusion protein MatE [Gracilibacillus kekensis]SHM56689.1 Na+-driven multidrug efflux pump [Gracilibacillus kekensis]
MKVEKADSTRHHVSFRTLLYFFIPLGLSASLVTISHVIINSTLARAPDPAVVIASYSVAMSLFALLERCAVILRQTCSTLVRDRISYKLMKNATFYVLAAIFLLSLILAYTPLGEVFFSGLLGVSDRMLQPTIDAYRVLMFVTIFSGVRCLYQGVIISNLKTKWLTIGMAIRLIVMAALAWFLLANDKVNHGYIGAYIFLAGMAVEALVSVLEGRLIVKELPPKKDKHHIRKQSQIFRFYSPLMIASLIAVSVTPTINAVLGWSTKAEIAIASYAVALSVVHLLNSIATYVHQIVINFYPKDQGAVLRFTAIMSLIPSIMLMIIGYSPVGVWIFENIIGVSGELLDHSILALQFFVLFTLCFPWIDFANGILMIRNKTKIMSFSQTGNVVAAVTALFILIFVFPDGGGSIGALAQSIGFLMELIILLIFLRTAAISKNR